MKVRCIDAKGHENVLREGNIYEGELKFIDSIGEERWSIKESRGSTFYKHRFEEVRELTFKEVIANIQKGEVWEDDIFEVDCTECGTIRIKSKKSKVVFGFYKDDTLKLKRKEHTFEEAFKALEEGKEIESLKTHERLKLKDGRLVYFDSYDNRFNHADGIEYNEIKGKWYIND